MNTKQFSELAKNGDIARVTLFRRNGTAYEIWAYGDDDTEREVNQYGNRLYSAKNEPRTYASLDRAYAAIREMGYNQSITIDG